MPIVSTLFGALLIVLGLDGYLDLMGLVRPEHTHSPTSLIPAYLGAVLVLCGLLALKPSLLKHAMHAAAAAGLVGLLAGAVRGLPRASEFNSATGAAVREQILMAGICLVFVALCVFSFVQARRRRRVASTA
jgi:hypothetical protein